MNLLGYRVLENSLGVLNKAILKYGEDYQTVMLIEESSECVKEFCKIQRGRGDLQNLCSEVVDLFITIASISTVRDYCYDSWDYIKTDGTVEFVECVRRINKLVLDILEEEQEELVIDSVIGLWYALERYLYMQPEFSEGVFMHILGSKLSKLDGYC